LRALSSLKAGTFCATIFIFWPVWGFLPSRVFPYLPVLEALKGHPCVSTSK
jgi:hypothetical protein